MRKVHFFFYALMICMSVSSASAQLWQGKGRIALSSDGNEHDDDDWAATPLSLALLASQGLQDKVVLYTYSDHIWGSNQAFAHRQDMTPYEHMRESALGAKERFDFDNTEFLCAVDNAEMAYTAMAKAINESTADNPLIIIGAGPMQVIGEAINRSNKDARQYVTVLSHSWWNNNHADQPAKDNEKHDNIWDKHEGWTFTEMKESFENEEGGNVKFVLIKDQNNGKDYDGLQAEKAKFQWIKNSPAQHKAPYKKGAWQWLYERIACCPKQGGELFDPSDAGMIVYLLTGEEKTDPMMAKELMENPVITH